LLSLLKSVRFAYLMELGCGFLEFQKGFNDVTVFRQTNS